MEPRFCELCHNQAAIYCTSDSAFLCSTCDAKVHHANFLVARHVRRALCSQCKCFSEYLFSGAQIRNLPPLCRSCSLLQHPFSEDTSSAFSSSSSSSSSTCVSSSESISCASSKNRFDDRPKNNKAAATSFMTGYTELRIRDKFNRNVRISVDSKARNVFENWCKKIGLENWKPVVSIGAQAFSLCKGRLAALPSRVALAAAFWLGLRYSGDRSMPTIPQLRRLEEISGVAAKVIVLTEREFSLLLRERRGRREVKEGWSESESESAV